MISASFKELGLQPITTSPRRRFQRRLTSAWDVGRAHLPMLLSTMLLIACALTPLSSAAAGEKIERRLNVGGQTRSYTAYLPDRRASSALRVLIAFHPALANGEFMERNTQLHNTPGAENFIVVYPDGLRRTWNAGACCGMAERMNADDLGFFDAMMADLRTIAPVRAKAYVTGYSNGALMVYQLACKRPERLAAAAPFAAYLPPETLKRCPGGRVPLMHMHGDSDAGAPVEGGQTSYLGKLPPAIDTIAVMARRNGCAMGRTGRQSHTRSRHPLYHLYRLFGRCRNHALRDPRARPCLARYARASRRKIRPGTGRFAGVRSSDCVFHASLSQRAQQRPGHPGPL